MRAPAATENCTGACGEAGVPPSKAGSRRSTGRTMKRSWYTLTQLLASTVLLGSCADQISPDTAEPPFRTSVAPDGSWVRVIRPGFAGSTGFSFWVPPGFQQLALQPIDSDAAVYTRQGASIHYDFGVYTSAPDAEGTETVRKRIRIGDRTALMISYRRTDGRYVIRAWWEQVSRGRLGANHLLMVGEFSSEADRPELLGAIYSVRFR